MKCSGQPALAARCPNESGPNAIWGTECHDFSEQQLRLHFAGKAMSFDHILDREQRTLLHDYCHFVVDKVVTPFIAGAHTHHIGIEERLEIITDLVWGTGDFLVTRTMGTVTDALLIDLKTGFHDVTVPENSQFAIYALGARKRYSVNGIIIVIGYLPRIESRDVPWEKWVMTQDDLDRWEKDVVEKATKAKAIIDGLEAATYVAGDHCTFCPAQGVCTALTQKLSDDSDILLSALPIDPTVQKMVVPPAMLTPEQRGRLLEIKQDLISYLESVEELALADMKTGVQIPGYKLVEGGTRRKWLEIDPEMVANELKGLGIDDPWQRKLITLGEVEKTIGKGKIGMLTEKSQPTIMIVPMSDKRVAIAPAQAVDMLTDLA